MCVDHDDWGSTHKRSRTVSWNAQSSNSDNSNLQLLDSQAFVNIPTRSRKDSITTNFNQLGLVHNSWSAAAKLDGRAVSCSTETLVQQYPSAEFLFESSSPALQTNMLGADWTTNAQPSSVESLEQPAWDPFFVTATHQQPLDFDFHNPFAPPERLDSSQFNSNLDLPFQNDLFSRSELLKTPYLESNFQEGLAKKGSESELNVLSFENPFGVISLQGGNGTEWSFPCQSASKDDFFHSPMPRSEEATNNGLKRSRAQTIATFPGRHGKGREADDVPVLDNKGNATRKYSLPAIELNLVRPPISKKDMPDDAREQAARSADDLYTPKWVRYQGAKKEGLCEFCEPGRWLQLKNSAYWSFIANVGITSNTHTGFRPSQDCILLIQ